MLKIWNKSWEVFGSCLLNSTANPAQFHPNWSGLAMLFSRQLLNGFHNFFIITAYIFLNYSIKNLQTTNALKILTHISLAIGGVKYNLNIWAEIWIDPTSENGHKKLYSKYGIWNYRPKWFELFWIFQCWDK
jgi:hypothetical protein